MSNEPDIEKRREAASAAPLPTAKLSTRLLVILIVGSLFVAFLISGIQIFAHYRSGIGEIENTVVLIENVQLPAIANSLYTINESQLQLQLEGLLQFRDLVYVEVTEDKDGFHFQRSAGDPDSRADRVWQFPLTHQDSESNIVTLGALKIVAGYGPMFARLRSNSIIIVVSTLVQVAVMAILAYAVIHFTVTRHLVHLSAFADELHAETLHRSLKLRRSRFFARKTDEIDRLASAINSLRIRIKTDIAHREAVKKELATSEARFRSLTDNLPTGVFRFSSEGEILFVNPALVTMFGYESGDTLAGASVSLLITDINELINILETTNRASSTRPVEVQLTKKDGTFFWASLKAIRMEDRQGKFLSLDGTIEDITARKQAETDARRRTEELESLYRLGQEVGASLSMDITFRIAIQHIRKMIPADMILLFLRQGRSFELKVQDPSGTPVDWDSDVPHEVGRCLCGLAAMERSPVYSLDIHTDPRCMLSECKNAGFRSFAAIPLESRDENLGVLGIASFWETDFSRWSAYLETVAHTIAIGTRNAILYRSVEEHAGRLEERLMDLEKSKKALRESEHRFRSFFNSSPEGVVLVDFEGRIRDANDSLLKATGYDKTALAGTELTHLVTDACRERIGRLIETIRKGFLKETPIEIEFRRRDGSEFPAVLRTWLVMDETGRSLALGVFVNDISTEKKLAEQKSDLERQLQQTQKMEAIGTLAGGIAHDFNNILGGIIGFIELAIQFTPETADRLSHYLYRTLEACNRAEELVEQILKFSRQNPMSLQSYALTPLLKEVIQFMRATLPAFIGIRSELGAETDRVMADIGQLHQVVMNLCTNAYHAMREGGGTLTLAMRNVRIDGHRKFMSMEIPPGDYLEIAISDTGPGIPTSHRERIFEPYFTTKKQNEGTGLGLAVSLGIVKNHSGLIELESREGEGSTFRVYLPVSEEAAEDMPREDAAVVAGDGERLLIVDDELFFLEVLREHLESMNYDVIACQSSPKALQSFRSAPDYFDLIITDQTMPDMTGVQLIAEIRALRADIPIILCTGFSETVTELSAAHYGISKFLMKPVHRVTLARSVHDLLTERPSHGKHSDHR